MTRAAVLLLLALPPLAGGCVAAVVPLAAGGLIARSQVPQAQNGPAMMAGDRRGDAAAIARPQPAARDRQAATRAWVMELPAPAGVFAAPAVDPFSAYLDQALAGSPAPSALLAKPSRLEPVRLPCHEAGEKQAPAVLIDLDPAGGLAPLDGAAPADPALAAALAKLRGRGLAIAWITDHPPGKARALRERLRSSGLDPAGADPLLMMRYPGEAKQGRRRALGRAHCVLAIAGDTRADFDELYQHLLRPAAAAPLEAMIGQGWFLIPNPLA